MTHQKQSDRASRTLARAIKLVPYSQRERYTREWRADLAAATPHECNHIARAALAMGWRLRLRDIGALLLGGHGVGKAVAWWIAIIAFVVLWPLFPLVFVSLCVIVVFLSLVYVGAPSRFSHWLMVVSGALYSWCDRLLSVFIYYPTQCGRPRRGYVVSCTMDRGRVCSYCDKYLLVHYREFSCFAQR